MDTPILAAQAPSDHSILGTPEQKRPLNDLPPDAQRVAAAARAHRRLMRRGRQWTLDRQEALPCRRMRE